ncbi:pentapeptide repeat-containing protein [Nostoc sp. UIC 10630]|uniref:pentapeptide repeat-containing protein n=1 Tax=Nostoc sp. UIC 10630 TaxID=2100146 RepID=UPI0013CF62AD|nr:pentapeptide repeat-containing protein [Nostoc sp. UIC 10630]NEU80969.1 pentapeptide repeat-containing protein [Nostoc sp. UIC 10630]
MPQDFSGQNLRGRSFRGQNLAGANFSYADIRGADFTGANLRRANFSHATAGLQKRWATLLVLFSWMLLGLSGFLSVFAATLVAFLIFFRTNNYQQQITYQIAGLTIIVVLVILFFVTIRQGIQASLGSVAVTFAVTFAGVGAVAVAVAGVGAVNVLLGFAIAVAIVIVIVVAGVFAFAIAVAFVVIVAFSRAVAFVVVVVAFTFAFTRVVAGAVAIIVTGVYVIAVAVIGVIAGAVLLFSSYISWQALKENEKYALIRNIAIAFAAFKGTSFRFSDLTDAELTGASLKSTDFRKAVLTRTCFNKTKKLDYVRSGATYLHKAKVRSLLVTGQGQDKNFDRENLRGVNFQRANLVDVSFIGTDLSEANLQDADLSRVKLVQTQLGGTDFTGATLTGAYIQDWGITTNTKFDGVRCEYVYMRLPTKENPDPLRKPDNHKEVFAEGEFGDFIQPIFDTLDLYHNQGVDPRAIAVAFKELAENNPNAELEIVAIERRGEDKILLRAKTTNTANKSELSKEYFINYNQLKALAEKDFQALIAQKEYQIIRLENMIMTALERPSFYAENYHNQGDTVMPESSKRVVNNYLQQAQIAGGLVNAETVTANQIGGNITNYTPEQRQNLAEAAADIQQLLNQLGQAYPTNTPLEKQIVVTEALKEIERNPTLKARVIGALKAGGTEALKELLDHPAVNVLLAALEGWQDAE